MFTIRIAQTNIEIDNKHSYIEDMCRDYVTTPEPDFTISVSDDDIKKEITSADINEGYAESLAIYRRIAERLLSYSGFLMHAVVADINGTGVAFLAPSGTGKTTHAELWRKCLGSSFKYVNGDKPLVRVINNRIYAYGTPWAGKENFHSNMKTKLKKVCFIKRAEENSCVRLKKTEILEPLMNQIYIPENASILSFLNLLSIFIESVEFYTINCNTDISAAKLAYEVIFDDKC